MWRLYNFHTNTQFGYRRFAHLTLIPVVEIQVEVRKYIQT